MSTSLEGQYRNKIDYAIGSVRWRSCILSVRIRSGMDCGTDNELLILNIRVKLKKNTKIIAVPKYKLNNILDEFKVHIRKIFALLNSIDH